MVRVDFAKSDPPAVARSIVAVLLPCVCVRFTVFPEETPTISKSLSTPNTAGTLIVTSPQLGL